MKILHVIGMAHGGAGEHVLALASLCDRRRFSTAVAMAAGSPMRGQFEQAGVRVLPLALNHFGGLAKNAVAYWQLARIMRQQRWDIVQTHTSVAGALGRIAGKRFTTAPIVHMLHAFAAHRGRGVATRLLARTVERRLDRYTDWYIAGSQAMVRTGTSQRIFSPHKVVLISNGIDLDRFADAGDVAPPPEPAPLTVGFLGRLEPQKGAEYLIRAAALVRREHPGIRFLLAGNGRLQPRMERLASQLGVASGVEFLGWTDDTVSFMKRIDVLAMPSLWEAFGLSAAEAMALRKPVIASRVDGLPEVIDEGRTGLLVPPGDCQALATAILQLAADPALRHSMGAQGRIRACERFSQQRMIARHEQFYERLVDRRGALPVTGGGSRTQTDAYAQAES
jgi:glycosyltransferase involved in cell wall biosynthesis